MERAKWMCNLGSQLAGSVQAICSHPQNIQEDEKVVVLSAIKSFPKGTSCGRDGLRAQHLLDAFSGTAAAISDELLHSIVGVVNLWLSGKCPLSLGEFIASAPLTPLLKSGGGVRPIAVGTIWRRLCSKITATLACKQLASYLGDFQFGVGTLCGGEGILHAANRLLELKGHCATQTMLLIDFTNAFNLVDRSAMLKEVNLYCPNIYKWVEFCYSHPTRLTTMSIHFLLRKGYNRETLSVPCFFALTLHPLAIKIAASCALDFHAWYLDDGTIADDTLEVAKALTIIQREGPERGLVVNINKTEIFWPSPDPRSNMVGVYPSTISRPVLGVKLLGGPVSQD